MNTAEVINTLGLLVVVLIQIGGLAAFWGGVKKDLENLHDGVNEAKADARNAHDRIDYITGQCQNRRKHS